jgi:hypothetical protein
MQIVVAASAGRVDRIADEFESCPIPLGDDGSKLDVQLFGGGEDAQELGEGFHFAEV